LRVGHQHAMPAGFPRRPASRFGSAQGPEPAVSPEIGYAGATEPAQSGPAQRPSATDARRRAQHRPATRRIAAPATSPPNIIRISGLHLPPSFARGLFNRRPDSRYGESERSELGSVSKAAIG
jgi:hypothetical protein